MKTCPICNTVYTDEEMRFCIRDGTPLAAAAEIQQVEPLPRAVEESDDAPTVVGTSRQTGAEPGSVSPAPPTRMVVTPNEPVNQPAAAAAAAPPPILPAPTTAAAPSKSFPVLPVVLATLGVLALVGATAFAGWYFLAGRRGGETAAVNANANQAISDSNLSNNSLSFPDFDANANLNANANSAAPSPKPSPSLSPSPKPSPSVSPSPRPTTNANDAGEQINSTRPGVPTILGGTNSAANSNSPNRTTPTPTPRAAPTTVSGGVVNGKATRLVTPGYPSAARSVRASGQVQVQVTIDESGNIISANAVSGHLLLRSAAEAAARQSKFSPTVLSGQPVKVTGVILYNFKP